MSGVSFSEARSLREDLAGKQGIAGVYQRSFADRTLEMDVTAELTSEEVALALEALGFELPA